VTKSAVKKSKKKEVDKKVEAKAEEKHQTPVKKEVRSPEKVNSVVEEKKEIVSVTDSEPVRMSQTII